MNYDGEEAVRIARGWLGVRFRHAGRDRGGVDCVGLAIVVARETGLDVPEPAAYSRHVVPETLLAGLLEHTAPVAQEEMVAGDLLLFKVRGQAQHVGIYAGDGRMVHAWETVGKVVEHRLDRFWRGALHMVLRVRSIPAD
jgi:cell wall-associated NlpC family hydrolase